MPAPTDPRRGAVSGTEERVELGVPELDHYLWGGVPKGSVALCLGPRFSGKESLLRTFLAHGIRHRAHAVAFLTDADATEWKTQMSHHLATTEGLDDPAVVEFVDFFPAPFPEGEASPNIERHPEPLTAEAVAAIWTEKAARSGGPEAPSRFVFDSLATLVHEVGPAPVLRFLPALIARVRRTGATGLVLADSGVIPEPALARILRHFGGLFVFRVTPDGHDLQVAGLGLRTPSPWIPYDHAGDEVVVKHRWAEGPIRRGR